MRRFRAEGTIGRAITKSDGKGSVWWSWTKGRAGLGPASGTSVTTVPAHPQSAKSDSGPRQSAG